MLGFAGAKRLKQSLLCAISFQLFCHLYGYVMQECCWQPHQSGQGSHMGLIRLSMIQSWMSGRQLIQADIVGDYEHTAGRQQYLPQSGVQVYSAASKISKEIKEPESQSTQPGRGKPHKHPKANMDCHGVPDACPDTFSNFLSVYFVSLLADVANTPLCAGDPPVTEEQAQQAFRIYSNESGKCPNFQFRDLRSVMIIMAALDYDTNPQCW